jgi:hypothetical protein
MEQTKTEAHIGASFNEIRAQAGQEEKVMASFGDRLLGAAKLRSATFEDVEHDRNALGQAMAVVILSSCATGIGMGLNAGAGDLLRITIGALASWFVWAALTFLIGTKMLATSNTQATWGEVLRTTGFAASPGLLRVLGVIPFTTGLIFFLTSIWMLVAFVVAVQAALDYRNVWRAVAVCFVGWLVYVAFGIFIL